MGLVMLGLLALVVLGFAAYMAFWQGTILMETRRHGKELQAQRELADQAEASRFTELRAAMQTEFAKVGERLGQAQDALRQEMRDSSNSLAATIGEIEDIDFDGWDYVWVLYRPKEDTDAKALVQRPVGVFVERVYDEDNFSDLGIG